MFKFIMNKHIIRQYGYVICANLCMMVSGMNHGWISPALVKLKNETNSILPRRMTDEEGSWVVSALLLSMIFSACMFYLLATNVWMLIAGRILAGISFAFMLTLIPTYSAEIASKEVRGALGTLMHISCCLGIVIMLCVGPHLSYRTLNIILAIMTVFCIIPFIFLPDTPYFLFSKGKFEQCRNLLTHIRGSEHLADEELKEYSETKLDVKISKKELFRNALFLKPLLLVTVLGITGQLAGFNVVSMYLETIFANTHTTVSPQWSSTFIGVIQLSASFSSSLIADKFGRKPILISTYFGMGVGIVTFGAFYELKQSGMEIFGFLNYLPVACVALFVFSFNTGHGAVYYVLVSELVEGPSRTLLGSFALQTSAIVFFVVIKSFEFVSSAIGQAAVYWFFGSMAFISGLFVAFFIPETNGKSFSEIQANFANSRT